MAEVSLPVRKHTRLKEYDYSQNGCYFVTVCVKDKKPVLSRIIVGRDAYIPPKIVLSQYGKIVDHYINNIEKTYTDVRLDNYIIMPTHIHLLITISDYDNGGMMASRPTNLCTIIRSMKTLVTKEIRKSIWQSSFYEEIIKSDKHFQRCLEYIQYNALKEYPNKFLEG